jgi:hypothetical protein
MIQWFWSWVLDFGAESPDTLLPHGGTIEAEFDRQSIGVQRRERSQ